MSAIERSCSSPASTLGPHNTALLTHALQALFLAIKCHQQVSYATSFAQSLQRLDTPQQTYGTLAPRAAIPPGAIVIAFSTLLDTDFALTLIDLCKRGQTVIAVDVLEGSPFETEQDPLVARMWSLQRSFMYRDMGTIGVDVVSWRGDSTLDQAMQLVPDRRRHAPARR
jgi:uncharacterized protein (DUF58 family)